MSSEDPYIILYDTMVYIHGSHHQYLLLMQEQCQRARTHTDLRHLGSDMHAFCQALHTHNTLEDKHLFPSVTRKTNISHLEAQHMQLEELLIDFDHCATRLKHVKNSEEDMHSAIIDANSWISKMLLLVNEHERAEEQIIEPENMKKLFTKDEMKLIAL